MNLSNECCALKRYVREVDSIMVNLRGNENDRNEIARWNATRFQSFVWGTREENGTGTPLWMVFIKRYYVWKGLLLQEWNIKNIKSCDICKCFQGFCLRRRLLHKFQRFYEYVQQPVSMFVSVFFYRLRLNVSRAANIYTSHAKYLFSTGILIFVHHLRRWHQYLLYF